MAIYEVHSQALLIRYKTTVCSKVSIFFLLCTLLTFISPLLIAFRGFGFWQRTNTYREQADVHFKYKVLLILEMSNEKAYSFVIGSSFPNLNHISREFLRIPVIKSREEDQNGDRKYDLLHLTILMPMKEDEDVLSIKLLLLFDYQLHWLCRLHMESLAYIDSSSSIPGAKLNIMADLNLNQNEPLHCKGIDERYLKPVINEESIFAEDYNINSILKSYFRRNVTTHLSNSYSVWESGRIGNSSFSILATIRYPEVNVLYYSGLAEMIRWAWIQYLAILVIFIYLFRYVKSFVFQHQILNTMIEIPMKSKMV